MDKIFKGDEMLNGLKRVDGLVLFVMVWLLDDGFSLLGIWLCDFFVSSKVSEVR